MRVRGCVVYEGLHERPPPHTHTRLPASPQTALLWVVAAYAMRRPTKDKDFFYDLGAVVVSVPVGLVAWGVVNVGLV